VSGRAAPRNQLEDGIHDAPVCDVADSDQVVLYRIAITCMEEEEDYICLIPVLTNCR